jgi:hypothetical protein
LGFPLKAGKAHFYCVVRMSIDAIKSTLVSRFSQLIYRFALIALSYLVGKGIITDSLATELGALVLLLLDLASHELRKPQENLEGNINEKP